MSWIWTRRRRGVCRCHSKHVQFTTNSILALWKCALCTISSTTSPCELGTNNERSEMSSLRSYISDECHIAATSRQSLTFDGLSGGRNTWKYLKNPWHLIVWLLVEENACLASQRPVLQQLSHFVSIGRTSISCQFLAHIIDHQMSNTAVNRKGLPLNCERGQ